MKTITKLAKDIKPTDVLILHGSNGRTDLVPFGNYVLQVLPRGEKVLIEIHGWDGDFLIEVPMNKEMEVEA